MNVRGCLTASPENPGRCEAAEVVTGMLYCANRAHHLQLPLCPPLAGGLHQAQAPQLSCAMPTVSACTGWLQVFLQSSGQIPWPQLRQRERIDPRPLPRALVTNDHRPGQYKVRESALCRELSSQDVDKVRTSPRSDVPRLDQVADRMTAPKARP